MVEHGKTEEAKRVLIDIGVGAVEADRDIAAIQQCQVDMIKERQAIGLLRQAFTTPHILRALVVGCALQMYQQITGINTIMYYSATIIQMAGVKNRRTDIWLSAVTAAVNFLGTFVGLYLVEKSRPSTAYHRQSYWRRMQSLPARRHLPVHCGAHTGRHRYSVQ